MKNDIRPRRIIGLTGFMGSGKSTVARLLARQIGWQYVDLDKLIAEATSAGDFQRSVLGTVVLSLFVVTLNRVFWRPLYARAERKFRIS